MAELREGNEDALVERMVLRGVDGYEIESIHARPEGMPRSGIVLHPDLMGIRPLFDDLCRRLATHGFAVCSPEPFARVPADARAAEDTAVRIGLIPTLDDELQLGDLERAADHLVIEDGVSEVAVLGFCMGGMQTLKAAATGRFDRAVAFYGMIRMPEAWQGANLREPLDTAAEVCPTLAIFGSADPYTPAADIEALREVWRDRPDCEIVVYDGADHGFVHVPERPAHRPEDAADAWKRTLAFLGVVPEPRL